MTEDEIWSIIQKGDRNFARCSEDKSINPNEELSEKFISNLVAHDIPHDDAELIEINFYDDDEGPGDDELQVPDTYSISAEGMTNVKPSDYEEMEMAPDNINAKDDEENYVGSDDVRGYLPELLYYKVTVPVTEEGLMMQLTKDDGDIYGTAIESYHHHENGGIALLEPKSTFRSKGEQIVRVEEESMHRILSRRYLTSWSTMQKSSQVFDKKYYMSVMWQTWKMYR
jgi:hypothetical protein